MRWEKNKTSKLGAMHALKKKKRPNDERKTRAKTKNSSKQNTSEGKEKRGPAGAGKSAQGKTG